LGVALVQKLLTSSQKAAGWEAFVVYSILLKAVFVAIKTLDELVQRVAA